jgi:hypothetical protein
MSSWWEADNSKDAPWYNQGSQGPAAKDLWNDVSTTASGAWDTVSGAASGAWDVISDPQAAWDGWDWRKQNIGKGLLEE